MPRLPGANGLPGMVRDARPGREAVGRDRRRTAARAATADRAPVCSDRPANRPAALQGLRRAPDPRRPT